MNDIVDRANLEAQFWIAEKVRQITKFQKPNDVHDCMDCGEPIGVQRKKSVPHAVRCIACQSELERGK